VLDDGRTGNGSEVTMESKTLFELWKGRRMCAWTRDKCADGAGGVTLVRLKMRNLLNRAVSIRPSRHRRSLASRT